jgi:hypothetical protein
MYQPQLLSMPKTPFFETNIGKNEHERRLNKIDKVKLRAIILLFDLCRFRHRVTANEIVHFSPFIHHVIGSLITLPRVSQLKRSDPLVFGLVPGWQQDKAV